MDTVEPPDPVRLGTRTAVPVDVEAVAARMTFDVAAQRATVEASVDFVVQGFDGCPVLDLRQPIESLLLDGMTMPGEAFPHQDLGGGPGAEMRVLDATLAAGSRHRLDLGYQLTTPDATGAEPIAWGDGVRFDLWMSDLFPGRYLEMWLPANLCHDRFALGLDIAVVGAPVGHAVVSNGAQRTVGPGRWRVDYPDRFTSLSPLLVLAPAPDLQVSHRQVTVAGRPEPLGLVTAKLAEADADLAACEADLAAWLTYNAERFGPWVHGDRFTAVIWASDRGMEYDGATTACVGALEHEAFHSWFGRGIKPARASDGWIDEAWTVWSTSNRNGGRFQSAELGVDHPPVLLYPPNPWSRHTTRESYREGATLMAGLAHLLGGPDRLRQAMATWYQANAGGFITTDDLQSHLTSWSGSDVAPLFNRYVHGLG
jgi:hypothetical protein